MYLLTALTPFTSCGRWVHVETWLRYVVTKTLMKINNVKSRIQYAHLYNTHPKLSQENCGKTLV